MHRALATCRGPATALAAIGMFWGVYSAWLPDVKARAGLGDGSMGLVLLGAACGNVAAMALFPRLARRFGARLLPGTAVALAAATVMQLAGQGPVTLFLALAAWAWRCRASTWRPTSASRCWRRGTECR